MFLDDMDANTGAAPAPMADGMSEETAPQTDMPAETPAADEANA